MNMTIITNEQQTNTSYIKKSKSNRITRFLTATVLILAVLVAAVPGILAVMRRADAQVALGNAKSLRVALQVASTEAYGAGRPFGDVTARGGVAGEVWQAVLMDSKVPGDFWVLQTDESGYDVVRFVYQERDFTVSYCKEPLAYEVYYRQAYIQTSASS